MLFIIIIAFLWVTQGIGPLMEHLGACPQYPMQRIHSLCINFLPKSDLMYIVLVLYITYMYIRMCVFVFIHMYICTL